MTTMPNLARANAILDEIDAGPPPPAWSPPRQPHTIVTALLDADGVWCRRDSLGLVELADDQPDAVPLWIEHRQEAGQHGVVVHLARDDAGTLWAALLCDDYAAGLVRSGELAHVSPAFIGDGRSSYDGDGRRCSFLRDARLVEVSLCEASATNLAPVGVASTDVRYSRNGLPLDWPDPYRRAYRAAWEALAPRSDVARYRASQRSASSAVPSVATSVGVMHTRFVPPASANLRVR